MPSVFYKPIVSEGYNWAICCDSKDYETFLLWDGSSQMSGWHPIEIERVLRDEGEELKPSEFPWLGSHVLIFSERAKEALGEFMSTSGEFLPLSCSDGYSLWAFNAVVVDALNLEKSKVINVPGSNRIMQIKHAVFDWEKIGDREAFRLPHRGSATYVSNKFVEKIKKLGFDGLDFTEVSRKAEDMVDEPLESAADKLETKDMLGVIRDMLLSGGN